MKSKSFDVTRTPTDSQRLNKTLDFVGLYKSAAETSKLAEKRKSVDVLNKDAPKSNSGSPSHERSTIKVRKRVKQEQLDVSEINIDGSNLNKNYGGSSPINNARVTSTPIAFTRAQAQSSRVKSIMKNASLVADPSLDTDTAHRSTPTPNKSKKRNKSVSFMLEDQEEVAIKKNKSEDTLNVESKGNKRKDKMKQIKRANKLQNGKENKSKPGNVDTMDVESSDAPVEKNKKRHIPKKTMVNDNNGDGESSAEGKNRKLKKPKKIKTESSSSAADVEENNNDVAAETKSRKHKKKKQLKSASKSDTVGEDKPDITEDLENLKIGDNAHTLTNLLDEMSVVDKDKRRKLKQKSKKIKKPKTTASSPEPGDSEKNEDGKEKIKWKRRKWNRDKKGDVNEENVNTSVIVENLPLSIMLNYKKLLTDHFISYGLIKKIGLAEVYPTEESKPVFTTTIYFYSDGAAEMALEKNNTQLEESRIRVKRPLPPTQTTLVVRSYAELTDQAVSSAFLGAGKIRSIRHLVKGKKTMATTFIEFDGPESVDRAMKMAAGVKIGGKKIHVAKFELRAKKNKDKNTKEDGDSAAEADSEDSND